MIVIMFSHIFITNVKKYVKTFDWLKKSYDNHEISVNNENNRLCQDLPGLAQTCPLSHNNLLDLKYDVISQVNLVIKNNKLLKIKSKYITPRTFKLIKKRLSDEIKFNINIK